ncbi:hypothetical protein ACOME3_009811 [Neoechinorhynchus agilis]
MSKTDILGTPRPDSTFKKLRPKIIATALAMTPIAAFLLLLSFAVDRWIVVTFPGRFYDQYLKRHVYQAFFGALSFCHVESVRATDKGYKVCNFYWLKGAGKDPFIDHTIIACRKAEIAFATILFALISISFAFGIYSTKAHRYMFKRLTGVLYFVTAICVLVCMELVNNMVRHSRDLNLRSYPETSTHYNGISTVFAWIAFTILILCSLMFLFCSSKLKGARATCELEAIENTPFELGR